MLYLSLPVILLDEVMKFISRARSRRQRMAGRSFGHLASVEVVTSPHGPGGAAAATFTKLN